MTENRFKKVGQVFAIAVALSMIISASVFLTFSTPITGAEDVDVIDAAPGSMIRLKQATFNPSVSVPSVPATLAAPTYADVVKAPYIIQAPDKVTEDWKAELRASGVEIVGYVPDNALLVRMDAPTLTKFTGNVDFRWAGAFQPAYKIDPALNEATGKVTLDISMFASDTNGYVVKIISKVAGGRILDVVNSGETNKLTAEIDASWIPELAQRHEVKWIAEHSLDKPTNSETTFLAQSGSTTGTRAVHAQGIQGEGEIVANGDSGINGENNDRFHQNLYGAGNIYNGGPKVLSYHVPPNGKGQLGDEGTTSGAGGSYTYHGSHTVGTNVGDGPTYGAYGTTTEDGHAFMAQLVMQDLGQPDDAATANTDESDYVYPPEDLYNDYFADAESYGAKVSSNSWGGAPGYTDSSAMIDRYIRDSQDFNVVFAAGNDGPTASTIDNQGEAKNVICVGSTDQTGGTISSFSSRGPATDGRYKPDLVIAGENIDSIDGGSTTGYVQMQGTSMATPAVAGNVALVRQYYREGWYPTGAPIAANTINPSAALVKATMINGAVPIGTVPNFDEGWGRLHLDNSLYFAGDSKEMFVIDQSQGLVTGDYVEYVFGVTDSTENFRATLVWSDFEGDPSAAIMLVNDLDLTVTGPGGTYLGNVFSSGQSTTGGSADTLNNIENVWLNSPATGAYTIRIDASNVAMGPQNFALVVTANFDDGYGFVQLDKAVYNEADTLNIRVEDLNKATSSITVNVGGSLSLDSETVTLSVTAPNSGVFTGSIPTGLGVTTAEDGILQVRNDETLTVTYADDSPAHDSLAYATVDIGGPMITNTRAENIMGTSAIIKWDTDENADSMVYYREFGTAPWSTIADTDLALAHSVPLTGLTEDTKYEFYVESTDWHGRTTTDDFGGRYYTLRTTSATTGGALILFVDDDDGALSEGGTGVPFEQDWFNNFDAYGWTYGYWEVATMGDPTYTDLNQAPMIIWNSAEGYPQIGQTNRDSLQPYLDQSLTGGGTVPMAWIAGQDIGWDMADGAGTDQDVAWYNTYLAADYWQDDSDGGGGTEGGTRGSTSPFQVTNDFAHPLNIYNLDLIDLEEDAYDAAGGRFWPDEISLRTTENPNAERVFGYNGYASGNGDCSEIANPNGGANASARIVYTAYAHEMIASTDDGATDWNPPAIDAERAQMTDQTIQWMLGGNHPTIDLTYPLGGEIELDNQVDITWTVSGASSIDVYYSPNGGQEYIFLWNDPTGTATSYAWDTTGLEDGSSYRVKVVALGTATYATLSDVSESGNFEINHGVDTIPPITVPGSVTVDYNPLDAGQTIVLTATITDVDTGGSIIQAAEWIHADNGVAPAWPGAAMTAVDGAFDEVTEDVTVTITGTDTSTWNVDVWQQLWVRGQDGANNWASSESTDVYVVGTPQPPITTGVSISGLAIGDWVFVSCNITASGNVTDVIDDVAWGDGAEDWDIAYWYDTATGTWKTYNKNAAALGIAQTMPTFNNHLGVWLRISALGGGGDRILSMGDGYEPTSESISLVTGWNMVGYPATDDTTYTVGDLKTDTGATIVQGYGGAGPYDIVTLADTYVLQKGEAYWVKVSADTTWIVDW